ncbi:MAG: SRPBCC family protein [Actinomycetota bacterium]|nr:SRPBCC family protein [Actinomycetota bacterium]
MAPVVVGRERRHGPLARAWRKELTEEFLVAGRRGRVVWTVRERVDPRRWVIDGRVEGGGGGTITYTATPHDAGTTFEREFVYATPNRLLALLDRPVLRRRIEAESAEVLRRSKSVLEESDTRQYAPTQVPGRRGDKGRRAVKRADVAGILRTGGTSAPSLPVPPGDWFYRLADSSGFGVG